MAASQEPFSVRVSHGSLLSLLLLPLWPWGTSAAQAPAASIQPPSTQLSPEAAYAEALHPLEATRRNIANWSDVEIAAMNVAIAHGKDACLARQSTSYSGAVLLDLARLCSLGQQWPAVIDAASRYIAGNASPSSPSLLTQAYIAKTEAELRLKQEPEALKSALTLITAVPYTGEVGECVDEALGYMRFVYTADALRLARARQPLLLAALQAPPPSPTPSVSALYAQGLLLPALEQLAAEPLAARQTVAALDAALPSTLSSDDTLRLTSQRQRYALLGKALPDFHPQRSLSMPYNNLPTLPVRGATTALLLFPDWCASCVKMGPELPPTVFTVEHHSAYLYALLAQTVPPRKPDSKLTNLAYNPAFAASLMAETPTLTVTAATLEPFASEDFPLLFVADSAGILRVLESVSAQQLQPGGEIDAAIALVGRNFNLAPAAPPAKLSKPGTPTR